MCNKRSYVATGRALSWASFTVQDVMETIMLSERWRPLRLKNQMLHRITNSLADCLVDLSN